MGWVGFLDSATVDWLTHGDLTIDEIADLTQEALIAAVGLAFGNRSDDATQERALSQVSQPVQRSSRNDVGVAPVDFRGYEESAVSD